MTCHNIIREMHDRHGSSCTTLLKGKNSQNAKATRRGIKGEEEEEERLE